MVDGHYYETRNSAESAFYVRILANLGIQQLILTNASGSLDKTHCPKGTVGLITDFDTNIPDPRLGTAKFVALTNIVSVDLNSTLKQLADGLNITLKKRLTMPIKVQVTRLEFSIIFFPIQHFNIGNRWFLNINTNRRNSCQHT